MKKIILAIGIANLLFVGSSCNKQKCDPVTKTAPASEVTTLENYLSTAGIPTTKDARGFFYNITSAGDANKPTVCNKVTVKYKGRFTTGGVFDESTTPISFGLSGLIVGWQEAIPLIGKGGSITIYLPPSLAYGAAGSGSIPPNTNLIFDIELIDFE